MRTTISKQNDRTVISEHLSPQCAQVLKLLRAGPVSGVEAEAVYRVRHLPRRIADLKEAGYQIERAMKRDLTGQRYASYTLTQESV